MDEYNPDFNGSIATLQRIDQQLQDCTYCRVNHQWIGYQNNLLELYKEVYDWLTTKEAKEGEFLLSPLYTFDTEEQEISIKSEDISRLDRYDIQIRQRIKKEGLTFKAKDLTTREERLRKNYGIHKKTEPERI